MIYELPYPMCGERRKQVRKPARNQYEEELARTLRGGTEKFYNTKIKKKPAYQWDEPWR